MAEKNRTMSDAALVEACRTYHENQTALAELGKRISDELKADEAQAIFVEYKGANYAVSSGSFDKPLFRKIRVPSAELCES